MEQRVDNQHQFWGLLATLAWGILILLGLVITQAITVAVYIVLAGGAAPRAGSPALESLKIRRAPAVMVSFCICDHLWTGRNHSGQIEARV